LYCWKGRYGYASFGWFIKKTIPLILLIEEGQFCIHGGEYKRNYLFSSEMYNASFHRHVSFCDSCIKRRFQLGDQGCLPFVKITRLGWPLNNDGKGFATISKQTIYNSISLNCFRLTRDWNWKLKLLLEVVYHSLPFLSGCSGKLRFHLTFNRSFRIPWLNGKYPNTFSISEKCMERSIRLDQENNEPFERCHAFLNLLFQQKTKQNKTKQNKK